MKLTPKWIRPVSGTDHGEVPAAWVQHIRVGDIVKLDVLKACPRAYQTENVLFDRHSLQVVRPARLSTAHLDQLIENQSDTILGNRQKYLCETEIQAVGRSLVFVKASHPRAYFTTPYNTKPRLQFQHAGATYDLPMTDVNFFDAMQENPAVLEASPAVYLTISLGICFEGKYYKLAAGVVHRQE